MRQAYGICFFLYGFVDHETTDLAWNWRLEGLCMATALQYWSYYTYHKVHAHIGCFIERVQFFHSLEGGQFFLEARLQDSSIYIPLRSTPFGLTWLL
jgi:hypothetical protein